MESPKIILAEDDADLGAALKQYFEFSGFEVQWFANPIQILEQQNLLKESDIAILDVVMPKLNGFDLAKKIREISDIPFLFLTAKGQSIDRILGLKLGAEDYIPKPCEPEELILRIQNILKRQGKSRDKMLIGKYIFTPSEMRLCFENENFILTEKEKELLLLLAKYNGKIVSRKEILVTLWGENDYFLGRSLDVFMSRLRKYFTNDPNIKFESIRGVGYLVKF